ncbi:MAG TPA: septal ring lytic transglycosylase RlpA family protein [Longimicrobiaceae bacterium]|nr:septal ring lytic transglycosylase RlpA family protein [Longimicrobiaceae bacterium]
MRFLTITTMVGALLTAAALGCAPERAPQVEEPPQVAMEQSLYSTASLSLNLLEELKERYPVLRETPAPEPQPNGDRAPEDVPERVREVAPEKVLRTVTGGATFYADKFEGKRTASGIPFRQNQMVAAHRAFPFGTILRVTNLQNNRSVNVRVVDRGPFGGQQSVQRTIIDLSRRAAQQLGYVDAGRTNVRVEVLEWGEGLPRGSG